MRQTPEAVGVIHFTGIGGIGMSGIAEVLKARGYNVQGSDLFDNANVQRLKEKGIPIFTDGQKEQHIENVAVLVVSSAIRPDNPELIAAKRKGIPIVHRSEMLAEIMRLHPSIAISGSHGKTTTTSLMSHIMDTAGIDPTIVNGGIIKSLGSNARTGSGDWLVAEADESDGSFIKLPATIGVVTNIDPEHLDHYGSFDAVRSAFQTFIENLPFYGLGVLCWDHPETQALSRRVYKRRIITYGETEGADVRFSHIKLSAESSEFKVIFSEKIRPILHVQEHEATFKLSMIGLHNISNAVSTIIVALHIGIPLQKIQVALANFAGVRRRFTKVGEVNGLTIIDDYAHHPVEICKTLEAARLTTKGKVIAIVQPHRYSRLGKLMDDFACALEKADQVFVMPVYAAGETPIPGVDAEILVSKIKKAQAKFLSSGEDIIYHLDLANKGDVAVFMGAGSITNWAYGSFESLSKVKISKVV